MALCGCLCAAAGVFDLSIMIGLNPYDPMFDIIIPMIVIIDTKFPIEINAISSVLSSEHFYSLSLATSMIIYFKLLCM